MDMKNALLFDAISVCQFAVFHIILKRFALLSIFYINQVNVHKMQLCKLELLPGTYMHLFFGTSFPDAISSFVIFRLYFYSYFKITF